MVQFPKHSQVFFQFANFRFPFASTGPSADAPVPEEVSVISESESEVSCDESDSVSPTLIPPRKSVASRPKKRIKLSALTEEIHEPTDMNRNLLTSSAFTQPGLRERKSVKIAPVIVADLPSSSSQESSSVVVDPAGNGFGKLLPVINAKSVDITTFIDDSTLFGNRAKPEGS